MREVNFSVPAANRASTGITTALYDRRALDCTSTLPLINSLNHLAYLTLSSPRIRQILTLDGGVERLVAMLKKGKSTNMLDNWKWHLALQCVVNIGVRGSDARASDAQGSESIRTRVVEADIVPVIATVLDNYIQAVESRHRFRRNEGEMRVEELGRRRSGHRADERGHDANHRTERRRPPPIEITPNARPPPPPTTADAPQGEVPNGGNSQPSLLSSPVDPSPSNNHYHNHHRQQRSETLSSPSTERPSSPVEPLPRQPNAFGPRETYLFPTLTTTLQPDPSSQPETPTTPTGLSRSGTRRRSASAGPQVPRTLRQASSMSGDSDEGEASGGAAASRTRARDEERLEQANAAMDVEMEVQPNVLDAVETQEDFVDPEVAGDADSETFNIRHRSIDGSLVETDAQPINAVFAPVGGMMDPTAPPENSMLMLTPVPPVPQDTQFNGPAPAAYRRAPQDDVSSAGILAWTPHDEDVIMSLQLLAYVSKYCVLRSYFQKSHLVPSLKTKPEASNADGNAEAEVDTTEEDHDNEYCQPDDYNIFPLVEKFTLRHYSADMKYWACVVMRNLCRKDKTRGDIRQCAYYKCGKWEAYARQFAKCRRCRQTKYCSKDCQKNAWVFHRHWCEPARESYQRHQHTHNPSGHEAHAEHAEHAESGLA